MLAKQVSPPTAGSCTARRIDPIGGFAMKVLSLCHSSAPSPFGLTWSSTVTVGRLLVRRDERRHVQRPEPQREREVLLVGQVLVAEEDDEVLEERRADRGDGGVVEGLAQVDAVDLGTDRRGERPHLDRSGGHVPPCRRPATGLVSYG